MVTDPQTNKQPETHRHDRLQYTSLQLMSSALRQNKNQGI